MVRKVKEFGADYVLIADPQGVLRVLESLGYEDCWADPSFLFVKVCNDYKEVWVGEGTPSAHKDCLLIRRERAPAAAFPNRGRDIAGYPQRIGYSVWDLKSQEGPAVSRKIPRPLVVVAFWEDDRATGRTNRAQAQYAEWREVQDFSPTDGYILVVKPREVRDILTTYGCDDIELMQPFVFVLPYGLEYKEVWVGDGIPHTHALCRRIW